MSEPPTVRPERSLTDVGAFMASNLPELDFRLASPKIRALYEWRVIRPREPRYGARYSKNDTPLVGAVHGSGVTASVDRE